MVLLLCVCVCVSQGSELTPESFYCRIECENPNNDLGRFRGYMYVLTQVLTCIGVLIIDNLFATVLKHFFLSI